MESVAPGSLHVVSDIVEALYEFRSGSQTTNHDNLHAPLLLLTAHRAKGLEFDHVVILDAGGWRQSSDDERRLYYVAMTRARKTLTLCSQHGVKHPFIRECESLCLKSQPEPQKGTQSFKVRSWIANPSHVKLSWPAFFSSDKTIHRAIAALDVGSDLELREKQDAYQSWQLVDKNGTIVARMSRAFSPPNGRIISVKVAAIMTRSRKKGDAESIKADLWEVVIPEICSVP
jgi:ATP-dependent DNA helicase RecQ